jgi:hypothetical protein
MSLTASAASAALTLLADGPDDGSKRPWRPNDPVKEQRDLYTQFVISTALGLSAFLAFCVRVLLLWCVGFDR